MREPPYCRPPQEISDFLLRFRPGRVLALLDVVEEHRRDEMLDEDGVEYGVVKLRERGMRVGNLYMALRD